jgi:hypothetical protein
MTGFTALEPGWVTDPRRGLSPAQQMAALGDGCRAQTSRRSTPVPGVGIGDAPGGYESTLRDHP